MESLQKAKENYKKLLSDASALGDQEKEMLCDELSKIVNDYVGLKRYTEAKECSN